MGTSADQGAEKRRAGHHRRPHGGTDGPLAPAVCPGPALAPQGLPKQRPPPVCVQAGPHSPHTDFGTCGARDPDSPACVNLRTEHLRHRPRTRARSHTRVLGKPGGPGAGPTWQAARRKLDRRGVSIFSTSAAQGPLLSLPGKGRRTPARWALRPPCLAPARGDGPRGPGRGPQQTPRLSLGPPVVLSNTTAS